MAISEGPLENVMLATFYLYYRNGKKLKLDGINSNLSFYIHVVCSHIQVNQTLMDCRRGSGIKCERKKYTIVHQKGILLHPKELLSALYHAF